jgi:cyclopropane fatty-acyl-phospholipid synthase-like methyltransferase
MGKKWFESWFNTPYYHILYKNRDNAEAALFIDNLFEHFHPDKHATLLDIACGRGRHAKYISDKGYDTTGIDLSESNIAYAKKYENENLHFHVQDMRQSYCNSCFDFAFNLFTSFGYFETVQEHLDALKVFNEALKPNGILVLDYFNATKAIKDLIPFEVKNKSNIEFNIFKHIEDKKIHKTIKFDDNNKSHQYIEEVFAFTLQDFHSMLELSNFTIIEKFGNYHFQDFDQNESPRLILICKKNHA